VFAEFNPNLCKPPSAQLVKSTRPFGLLGVYFKGPLPSLTKNDYFLTFYDEYSRFPFALCFFSTDAETIISCLHRLFVVFGFPAYDDLGPAFMSSDFTLYLHSCGISCSKTSIYNPHVMVKANFILGLDGRL